MTQWDIQENKEIWTRSKLQQGQVRNNYVFNIRFRSVDTRPPTCSLNYSQGWDRWLKGIELYSILSPFIIIQLTEWLIFFSGIIIEQLFWGNNSLILLSRNPLSRCFIIKKPTGTSHPSTITFTHTQTCQGIPYLFQPDIPKSARGPKSWGMILVKG